MKTMAFLCDHAQVHAGKLFISGGTVNKFTTANAEPPFVFSFALATVITMPWNATNQKHTMTIELVSDQGSGASRVPLQGALPNQPEEDAGLIVVEFNAGRAPDLLPGEEQLIPFALPLPSYPFPTPGSYFFRVCIDGTEVALAPLKVIVAAMLAAA